MCPIQARGSSSCGRTTNGCRALSGRIPAAHQCIDPPPPYPIKSVPFGIKCGFACYVSCGSHAIFSAIPFFFRGAKGSVRHMIPRFMAYFGNARKCCLHMLQMRGVSLARDVAFEKTTLSLSGCLLCLIHTAMRLGCTREIKAQTQRGAPSSKF